MKDQGFVALVLHAHLPFVRHPEHDEFLEEDWLFEAITETYLPLYQGMEGMAMDGVPFRLTLSMSPPLVAMPSRGRSVISAFIQTCTIREIRITI